MKIGNSFSTSSESTEKSSNFNKITERFVGVYDSVFSPKESEIDSDSNYQKHPDEFEMDTNGYELVFIPTKTSDSFSDSTYYLPKSYYELDIGYQKEKDIKRHNIIQEQRNAFSKNKQSNIQRYQDMIGISIPTHYQHSKTDHNTDKQALIRSISLLKKSTLEPNSPHGKNIASHVKDTLIHHSSGQDYKEMIKKSHTPISITSKYENRLTSLNIQSDSNNEEHSHKWIA